jgi:WS/DGAT C-terminal domain
LGLVHFVTSYQRTVAITVIVDAVAMPDPERYEDLLREALGELERSATGPGT